MKITLSKSQWEEAGKKAGWVKTAQLEQLQQAEEAMQSTTGEPQQPKAQLTDFIKRLNKMQDDFRKATVDLPKNKYDLIGADCDAVVQYLDSAAGRISTIIHKTKV